MLKRISLTNSLILGIIILCVAFVISRLPLFLKLPIPTFWPDSYEYFYYVQLLNTNVDSIGNLALELPIGYPLFCYFLGFFTTKVYPIVIFQHFINLFASIYLLYIIYKYFPKVTLWVSLALAFILVDSQSILYDNMLMPESIYKSVLIVCCGAFISVIKSQNIWSKIGLALSMVLIALIRPNGIFIYILFPAVLFYFFINKVKWQQYAYFIIPFLLLNFGWAIYNAKVSGYFMFGNMNRIKYNFSSANDHIHIGTRSPKEILLRFNAYIFSSQRERKILRYDDIAKLAYMHDKRKFFVTKEGTNDTIFAEKSQEEFLQKEFYGKSLLNKVQSNYILSPATDSMEWSGINVFPKGIFFHYYFLSLNILSPFYNSFLWILLFFIVLVYSSYQYFKTKNSASFILLSFCLIHLLSLIVVAIGNVNLQYRYEYVTGFLIYLIAAMSPIIIKYDLRFLKQPVS